MTCSTRSTEAEVVCCRLQAEHRALATQLQLASIRYMPTHTVYLSTQGTPFKQAEHWPIKKLFIHCILLLTMPSEGRK